MYRVRLERRFYKPMESAGSMLARPLTARDTDAPTDEVALLEQQFGEQMQLQLEEMAGPNTNVTVSMESYTPREPCD